MDPSLSETLQKHNLHNIDDIVEFVKPEKRSGSIMGPGLWSEIIVNNGYGSFFWRDCYVKR